MRQVVATVVLVVHQERALVLRRRPNDRSFAHAWCLPGGGVDGEESVLECARREAREETGLEVRLDRQLGMRETPLARRNIVFHIHQFTGYVTSSKVTLSEEHVDHRWLTREQAGQASALPGGLAGETTTELLARFARGELP